ncbi:hypothetical protein C8Q80DRAFT_1266274 [Daedaleopsis nitida]|nr:hypothetical protein C8Q80DRAFT_1266274 [Daedaleopsis nitida]
MAATWRLSFDLLSPALIVEPCSALAAQVLVDAPARLVSSLPSTISRNTTPVLPSPDPTQIPLPEETFDKFIPVVEVTPATPPTVETTPLPPAPITAPLPSLPAVNLLADVPDDTGFILSIAMSEAGLEKNLPTLRGQEGYREWSHQVMGYLLMVDAWDIVNGMETAPAY